MFYLKKKKNIMDNENYCQRSLSIKYFRRILGNRYFSYIVKKIK